MNSKAYVLLSPEYEREFEFRYGKQPRFIPVDFISNTGLPDGIAVHQDHSRVWMANPNVKRKDGRSQ